jgi:integrase
MTPHKLGLDANTWTYRFKFEGHRYTLIKRNHSRDGAWWIQCVHAGKRIVRSLDTNIAAAAEQRAIAQFIKPAKAGNWAALQENKLRDDCARIGSVLACYQELCVGRTSPLTVRNNLNGFRLVVRRGLGNDGMTDEAVNMLPSSVLTGKLVADFEDWMARQAVAQGRDLEANKRSVESYLRHARSIFKATAVPRYAEKGIKLADVSGFMTRQVERAAKLVRQAPDDKLLARTFEAAQKLRLEDRPAYVALLLGMCSLRRGEIARAKWSWIVEHAGRHYLLLPAHETKSGAARTVPVDPRVIQELQDYKVQRCVGLDLEEEQFVLPSPRLGRGGPHCRLRAQNVFKRLNNWMRLQGWTTNHTLHEMRALALGLVRDTYGLDTAQAVAGHSDQRTTQAHYVGLKSVKDVSIVLPLVVGQQG